MLSTNLSYSVIYSNRKTISIGINQDGSVFVRSPRFVSKNEIDRIVNQKREWILSKQKLMVERSHKQDGHKRTYEPNSTMPYLGQEYPLEFIKKADQKQLHVQFENETFKIYGNEFYPDEIKQAFRIWYINKAKEIYFERISYYHKIIQEPFGQVRIKEQKSCYGSCSSKRNLNFNWKCILAPLQVLDYVVVHELCHLKQLNHSPKFWAEVEKVMPDYKEQKQWLKTHRLDI